MSAPGEPKPLIIIVDDDRLVLGSLHGYLSNKDFIVVPFLGLAELFAFATQARVEPALLVVDYGLPADGEGDDALARVRGLFGGVPFIVLTGDTSDAAKQRVAELGGLHLSKPVHPADLDRVIAALLSGAGA